MLDDKQIGYIMIAVSLILIFILIFVKTDVDQKAANTCEIIADNPNITMEECPYHQSNTTSWLILVAFGIGILLLGGGLYLILRPEEEGSQDFKDVDVSKLSEDEQNVYEALNASEGTMYQSDLIDETGLSKVKMTRTLDKLETKDIVERKRRGMTNLVVLR